MDIAGLPVSGGRMSVARTTVEKLREVVHTIEAYDLGLMPIDAPHVLRLRKERARLMMLMIRESSIPQRLANGGRLI